MLEAMRCLVPKDETLLFHAVPKYLPVINAQYSMQPGFESTL